MDDRLKEILQLYDLGVPYTRIAKKFGISRSRIYQLLRNHMDELEKTKPIDEPE